MTDLFENEMKLRSEYPVIAGVDEAGRGPLAGPLVVAACVLPRNIDIANLNDSKRLSERIREELYDEIVSKALDFSIVEIDHKCIDQYNILGATMIGMKEAVAKLKVAIDLIIIDGNRLPENLPAKAEAIVKGDSLFASIAAASILAKVTRDRIMRKIHQEYPSYNFFHNKGYPTKEHLAALDIFGVCEHHRLTFKPVRDCLESLCVNEG